jgi:putative oxidoreductase
MGETDVMQNQLKAQSDLVLLIARVFLSSLMIVYGYFKLTGFAGATAYMGKLGLPAPALFATLAVIIELGGGILLLVGYQTRLVALGLAIYTVVAALIAHRNFGDGNQLAHFWKNMSIAGGMLAFAGAGAGAYSVDR